MSHFRSSKIILTAFIICLLAPEAKAVNGRGLLLTTYSKLVQTIPRSLDSASRPCKYSLKTINSSHHKYTQIKPKKPSQQPETPKQVPQVKKPEFLPPQAIDTYQGVPKDPNTAFFDGLFGTFKTN